MKKQKAWSLFLIPVLIPLIVIALAVRQARQSEVNVYIGVHPAGDQTYKTSLKRLSDEVQEHPKAVKFIIRSKVPLGPSRLVRFASNFRRSSHTTVYLPRKGLLTAERFGDGSNYRFEHVTDQTIHSVAAKNGTFDDLINEGYINVDP